MTRETPEVGYSNINSNSNSNSNSNKNLGLNSQELDNPYIAMGAYMPIFAEMLKI